MHTYKQKMMMYLYLYYYSHLREKQHSETIPTQIYSRQCLHVNKSFHFWKSKIHRINSLNIKYFVIFILLNWRNNVTISAYQIESRRQLIRIRVIHPRGKKQIEMIACDCCFLAKIHSIVITEQYGNHWFRG